MSFKNTLIMLTSNLASDIIQNMTADGRQYDAAALNSAIRPVLSRHFQPALLARMSIVPYVSLGADALEHIVLLKLDKLKRRMAVNSGMQLRWTETVPRQIAARCTEVETGARNVDYILNGSVLPRLAREILAHMSDGNMPAGVTLGTDEQGTFTLVFDGDAGDSAEVQAGETGGRNLSPEQGGRV